MRSPCLSLRYASSSAIRTSAPSFPACANSRTSNQTSPPATPALCHQSYRNKCETIAGSESLRHGHSDREQVVIKQNKSGRGACLLSLNSSQQRGQAPLPDLFYSG